MLAAALLLAVQGPIAPKSTHELTLAFTTQPSAATAGAPIAPAVKVAVAPIFRAPFSTSITLSLADNPGGATLSGTLTQPTVNGVATFADVTLDKAASGYRLRATAPGFQSATSAAFDVAAAAPSKLAFVASPASGAAWAPLAPAPAVEVQDAFGNRVVAAANAVTLSFDANPGTNALRGTGTASHVLERIDPTTPALLLPTPIQTTAGLSALVVEPFTGVVIAADTANNYLLLDKVSGAQLVLGAGNLIATTKGLAFDAASGGLFSIQNATASLFATDLFTGQQTFAGTLTLPSDTILGMQGLATDPTDGQMYGVATTAVLGQNSRALVKIDPATQSTTIVGGTGDKVAAIAFRPDGSLFAITGAGSLVPKTFFKVNKATGAMTPLLAIGNGDISESMTIVPALLMGPTTASAAAGLATFPGVRVDAPAAGYALRASAAGLASAVSAPFAMTAPDLSGTVAWTSTGQTVQETAGTVTVQLAMAPAQPHDVVAWAFVTGTASGPGAPSPDHDLPVSIDLPILVPAGQTSATLTFHVIDDGVVNPGSKTCVITLKRAALGAVGAPAVHTVTIVKV